VTVEEVGVAALLEDGGHLLGLVVVQLDLAITLIMPPHSHLENFSQEALVRWVLGIVRNILRRKLLMPAWKAVIESLSRWKW
jgi:hypothetical protein